MFNHSHIRHFSSVFVSLRDFQLITQNSSENIASRQSRCIYVNGLTTQYPEVFEGVRTLPDILHLEIDNSVPPVQLPVRRIPLAVRDNLKHEIDRLVELKVITPVDSPTD